ncbi:MAG: hypothetical protein AAF297_00175 [Planctomycetota bacterium]
MQTTRFATLSLAAATLLVAGLAVAPAAAQSTSEPLLSGPSVDTTDAEKSLVRRGFDGEMERLGQQPEIAAVEMLELSESERLVVDLVLGERAALIDGIVRANRSTIQEMGQSRKARDREGVREAMQKLQPALQPALDQGSLTDLISAALPDAKQTEFTTLLSDYNTAVRENRRAQAAERVGAGEDGEQRRGGGRGARRGGGMDAMGGPADFEAAPQFELELGDDGDAAADAPRRGRRGGERSGARGDAMRSLMQEIQASYGRLVAQSKDRQAELNDLLTSLDLSADQQAAIEATIAEVRESRGQNTETGEPSRQERVKLMRAIAQHLTAEQREVFRAEMRSRRN